MHLDHHKYFGEAGKDPEYESYSYFPRSKLQMLWRLVKNASGIVAIPQFFLQKPSVQKYSIVRETLTLVVVHSVLFAIFTVLLHWWMYFVFWAVPVVTVAKFFSSTRGFCEHGSPDDIPVYRTITGNSLQTLLFGMFHFNFHAEHHAHPALPYSSLSETHSIMFPKTDRIGDVAYVLYEKGYLRILLSWFRGLPLSSRKQSG